MRIAIDYDGTYTADPGFWDAVRKLAIVWGHVPLIVTKRGESNKGFITLPNWEIHHTDRKAKAQFCKDHNIQVDIWIDDEPTNIYTNG